LPSTHWNPEIRADCSIITEPPGSFATMFSGIFHLY
jgi:hypothetical protein